MGVFDNLEKALAFDSKDGEGVIENLDVLKNRFRELIEEGKKEYLSLGRELMEDKKIEQSVSAEIFKAKVLAWAKKIKVKPMEIHIRPMKRKWASSSSQGRLTFDVELLKQPAKFRSKVVVHELLHLKIPNHGPLFRSLAKALLSIR